MGHDRTQGRDGPKSKRQLLETAKETKCGEHTMEDERRAGGKYRADRDLQQRCLVVEVTLVGPQKGENDD